MNSGQNCTVLVIKDFKNAIFCTFHFPLNFTQYITISEDTHHIFCVYGPVGGRKGWSDPHFFPLSMPLTGAVAKSAIVAWRALWGLEVCMDYQLTILTLLMITQAPSTKMLGQATVRSCMCAHTTDDSAGLLLK